MYLYYKYTIRFPQILINSVIYVITGMCSAYINNALMQSL